MPGGRETPATLLLKQRAKRALEGRIACLPPQHPNYTAKHDPSHAPKLGGGMVVKVNANQRYATNAVTGFFFKELGHQVCSEHASTAVSPCPIPQHM